MERVYSPGLTVENMSGSTLMTKSMDKEFSNGKILFFLALKFNLGQMVENILEDGSTVNNMEKEHLLLPMGKRNKESGKMVSEKDGLFSTMIQRWMTLKINS